MNDTRNAIDCDIHPAVPSMQVLLPYLDEYWREHLITRGTERLTLHMTSFPPNAPQNSRPDWKPAAGLPGIDLAALRTQALDAFGTQFAICNVLYASQMFFNEDMAAVLCRAVNDWVAAEWLANEPRLRASIMVSTQNPQLAANEIDRCAADPRFVQVLLLANTEMPAGRRYFWPIYEAAERHNLPVGFHAGSSYRFAPSNAGFPSFFVEEYAGNAPSFKGELLSLITEGVFQKFPALKVVMIEAGFTWLPGYCWRIDKIWRGVRREVPWVKEAPSELIRRHVRFTLQPTHTPPDPQQCARVIDQIGSDDILLFSTDYPHWHFDGTDAFPNGFPQSLKNKIMVDNPLATYPRLQSTAATQAKRVAS
ncbi:MAG: amidohydrolase family protein [Xanthobacteraceae bacterium]